MQSIQSPVQLRLPIQSTPFFGRSQELDEFSALLSQPDCRLLTLIGPGGIGKTRLAIELADHNQADFPEGIIFVSLDEVTTAEEMLNAIQSELSNHHTQAIDNLSHYLYERQILLILDNFEHLVEHAPLISQLLSASIYLKIIVTSREILNLHEEWVRHIMGMRVPANEYVKHLEDYCAVQLFVACAERVRHNFSFEDNRAHVVHICQMVGGMPLAIELAAGWLKTLNCAEIAKDLEDNLDILSTRTRNLAERHRSIRTVFEQTWNKLSPEAQIVYQRLSVFYGSFRRQAAQQIANASLPILSDLVDHALLYINADGRYQIHELLRKFAEEKLKQSGNQEQVYQSHVDYCHTFLSERLPQLKQEKQVAALNDIGIAFKNILSAWQWASLTGQYEFITTVAESLFLFCWMRAYFTDGIELFSSALDLLPQDEDTQHQLLSGRLKLYRLWLELHQTPHQLETEMFETLEAHRANASAVNETHDLMLIQLLQGFMLYHKHDYTTLIQNFQSIDELFNDKLYRAYGLEILSLAHLAYDEMDKHIHITDDCLALRQEIKDTHGLASSMRNAGYLAMQYGNFGEAERRFIESNQLYAQVQNQLYQAQCTAELGFLTFSKGDISIASSYIQSANELADDSRQIEVSLYIDLLQSLVLLIQGDYLSARDIANHIMATTKSSATYHLAKSALAMTACGLDDLTPIRDYHLSIVRYAIKTKHIWRAILSFPTITYMLANDSQMMQAVEVLAHAFNHPVSAMGWMTKWDLVAGLRTELEASLASESYKTAWERGKLIDTKLMLTSLKSKLQVASLEPELKVTSATARANQALIEPLSQRELEVLQLIVMGLTNSEIADKLFIGLSTVKKHINHIYSKLNTKSRVQAIVRAKELNLVKE